LEFLRFYKNLELLEMLEKTGPVFALQKVPLRGGEELVQLEEVMLGQQV
jgi:hypothetical protein